MQVLLGSLRRVMAVENVSARQLARGVGFSSHSYVNRIVSGDVTSVAAETAKKIARYLHVDVDDLFVAERPAARAGRRVSRKVS